MTARKTISNVAAKLAVCAFVAAGLALVGCTNETIEVPSEMKADQQKYLSQEPNQGAKNKAGKPVGGVEIKTRTFKKLKGAAAPAE
jgi:hypothetical protein